MTFLTAFILFISFHLSLYFVFKALNIVFILGQIGIISFIMLILRTVFLFLSFSFMHYLNKFCSDYIVDKTLDLTKVNLKKLKVKDLKSILSDWDETCKGCTEKSDFIKLIEELMPKYAPDAHQARQKQEL